MSLGEWIEEATPRRAKVAVCFDGGLTSRWEEAKERALKKATMLGDTELMEARAELEKLEEEMKAKTHVFVFESIGWGRWRDLIAKHPPKDGDRDIWERAIGLRLLPDDFARLEADERTWAPAVLVATCVEPGIPSTGEALKLIEMLHPTMVSNIWNEGVLKANIGGISDPFVAGFIDSEAPLGSERKQKLPLS
jgi:hypothetical protein